MLLVVMMMMMMMMMIKVESGCDDYFSNNVSFLMLLIGLIDIEVVG
jgi:hypothetical protein